jgi:hypothetical protein
VTARVRLAWWVVAGAVLAAPAHARVHDAAWRSAVLMLQQSAADSAGSDSAAVVPPAPERHRSFQDLKPGRDVLHGLRVTGEDAWAVARGPFHMDRSDALWTLGALAVTGAVYASDADVLDALHRSREDDTYDALLEPGRRLEKVGLIGTMAPYYAAGLAVGYALRIDPLTQMTSEVLESHLITGVLRQALERGVGRKRPREDSDPHTFAFNDGDSFPSGHASVVFELATVASYHTRSNWLRVLYYALATSVALERADSDAHWPSDVVAGAAIGTVVARSIVRRHDPARK